MSVCMSVCLHGGLSLCMNQTTCNLNILFYLEQVMMSELRDYMYILLVCKTQFLNMKELYQNAVIDKFIKTHFLKKSTPFPITKLPVKLLALDSNFILLKCMFKI